MPGVYGTGVAFVAELVISYALIIAILYASNHVILSRYTHHLAAVLRATYIAFESPYLA
jgi:aquaporin Z